MLFFNPGEYRGSWEIWRGSGKFTSYMRIPIWHQLTPQPAASVKIRLKTCINQKRQVMWNVRAQVPRSESASRVTAAVLQAHLRVGCLETGSLAPTERVGRPRASASAAAGRPTSPVSWPRCHAQARKLCSTFHIPSCELQTLCKR